jgi:hypothetical protein
VPCTALAPSLPPVRFRLLRIVTVGGIYDWPTAEAFRGEARGGVEVGAGSLDRAELTRCSSFCIFPMRPRIWWSEPEAAVPGGSWGCSWCVVVVRRGIEGVERILLRGMDGRRECREVRDNCVIGRAVLVELVMESRDLETGTAGVPDMTGNDVSDVGGEGGVGVSETIDEADLVGGVAMVGDDAVVVGEFSDVSDRGRPTMESRGDGFRSRCRSPAASA